MKRYPDIGTMLRRIVENDGRCLTAVDVEWCFTDPVTEPGTNPDEPWHVLVVGPGSIQYTGKTLGLAMRKAYDAIASNGQ